MIQTRKQGHFGPEYEQLLLTVFANLPYRLQAKTRQQAFALRIKCYGYFKALREENLRLDLIEMADALTLTVEDTDLVFVWKKDRWDSAFLREVLALPDNFAEDSGGKELHVPDLLATRLTKQLALIRERKAHAANIVPPFKTGK